MPCVYILYSKNKNKYYTGSSRSNDAGQRLIKHNNGQTRSTKAGRPWKIVYQEQMETYTEARKRELFLKSGQGRKWIKINVILERCQSG